MIIKKNILHVITGFNAVGGAEMMLIRAINSSDSGYKHTIVSLTSASNVMVNKLNKNVDIKVLNSTSAFSLLLSVIKLKAIFKSTQFDVTYSWMYHANFVTGLAKMIGFITGDLFWGVRHSLDDFKGEGYSTKLAIYGGRAIRFIPNNVIYCANRAMKQHIDFGYSKEHQSIYIPNGYDFEQYQSHIFNNKILVLGAAGRFHNAKDYKTLFKAVAPILHNNKGFQLKVAGRDIDNANSIINEYIKELNIKPSQVKLLGELDDMPAFYRSVDFFILSSKTEGFPNVLAEASGYGCITFSTNVGDAGLIINNQERLVKIGDATAMTQLLNKYIIKSPEELNLIANQSAKYVRENYSILSISKQIFSLGNK